MNVFNEAHVLILNRSTITAENLKKRLKLQGFKEHKIYICYSPSAAFSSYFPVKFDLIISEHLFPKSRLTSVEVFAEIRGKTCRNATFIVLSDTPLPELNFNSDIDDVVVVNGASSIQEVMKRTRKAFLSRKKMRLLGLASDSEPLGDLLHKCNMVEINYPELYYSIQKYRGDFFSAYGKYDVTVNLYRSMLSKLDKGMDDSWLHEVLITALVNNDQVEEAQKLFSKLSRNKADLPPRLQEVETQIFISKANIAGAIEKYENLATQISLNVEKLRLMGHMYLFAKKFDKCLESFLQAVQLTEGTSRTQLENRLLYIRALLYVRNSCNDTQPAYRKKFDLEVKKILKQKFTVEDKIKLSIIDLHGRIFNGHLSSALQMINDIIPVISKVDSSTKAHFLSILDNLMLDKEFAYVYQKIKSSDKLSSNMEKSINEHLITQRFKDHQYRHLQSKKIAAQVKKEMNGGSLEKACKICLDGYELYPYNEHLGLSFLTILTKIQPENMGKKQVNELVTSINNSIMPFFPKESLAREKAEHTLKLALDRYH